MNVLVTGADGFVGSNLCAVLRERDDVKVFAYDVGHAPSALDEGIAAADLVFHLAGVNRPQDPAEFETGNAGSLVDLIARATAAGRAPRIVLSSSTQAALDNPYGRSKRAAEDVLRAYCERTGATGVVHRLYNLFGKWCRPNYNSVTATFCHNIARGLPIQISDPANVVTLTYIGDVVQAFLDELAPGADIPGGFRMADPLPSRQITLGELAATIESFRASRTTLRLPDYADPFVRALYATYLSYLEPDAFAYTLDIKTDPRGSLAEFVKSPSAGQIFVSRTKPGITRGNHYHHTKTEKFLVVEGDAIVRFRSIRGGDLIEYRVSGHEYRVVDIPPGYTHSIENVGTGELVTLFWASEIFDPGRPDTRARQVL